MSFTKALYYPSVRINNESWLKNAILYWDTISTIVPENIDNPYKNRDAEKLRDEGWLSPVKINSDTPIVRDTSRQCEAYFTRLESLSVLLPPSVNRDSWQADKLRTAFMYPGKISYELQRELFSKGYAQKTDEGLEINQGFANYYMTVLAANLADYHGLALLADENRFNNLANLVRGGDTNYEQIPSPHSITEGMLSQLVFRSIQIEPDTPIEKVIQFRKKHQDELSRFRKNIEGLTQELKQTWPSLEALQQKIADIYRDEVIPATNDLEASMKAFKFRCFTDHIKTSLFGSAISILPGTLLEPMLGPLATPIAIFAGAGISIVINTFIHRLDKQAQLRANPYSYVLALRKTFG